MNDSLVFTWGGEMDNGMTVDMNFKLDNSDGTAGKVFDNRSLALGLDGGGTITFWGSAGSGVVGTFDDMMPTAYEEPTDGIDFTPLAAGSGVVGHVDGGKTGFNYSNSFGMANVNIGYAPSGSGSAVDDGGMSGDSGNAVVASTPSATSIAITASPMDGLTVFAGRGDKGADSTTEEFEDTNTTYGFTYAMGAVTVGVQQSEIEDGSAGGTADEEMDAFGIAFAINDNLSISYGYQEVSVDGVGQDQEITGMGLGYSMGGMTIKAQHNEGERNVAAGANQPEYKRTEILVGFAFKFDSLKIFKRPLKFKRPFF